jgi:hypothetical protein
MSCFAVTPEFSQTFEGRIHDGNVRLGDRASGNSRKENFGHARKDPSEANWRSKFPLFEPQASSGILVLARNF